MLNSKKHAFLICPATQTDAVGGTPPTRGADGGQIKKAAWVSAYEAAISGLHAGIAGDQCLVHVSDPRLCPALKLRPYVGKVIRAHGSAIYRLPRVGENAASQSGGYGCVSVGAVIEVAHGGFHLLRELFPLVGRKAEEVGFEVHSRITPFNELDVNTIW